MSPIIFIIACNENTSEFEFTDKFWETEGILKSSITGFYFSKIYCAKDYTKAKGKLPTFNTEINKWINNIAWSITKI